MAPKCWKVLVESCNKRTAFVQTLHIPQCLHRHAWRRSRLVSHHVTICAPEAFRMKQIDPQHTPVTEHFKRLMLLRGALAFVLVLTICVAVFGFGIELRWDVMIGVVLLLPAANLATRARVMRGARIGEIEFFLQLLLDVAVLSALLYLSGGSTNPFVSLYLLPLVIAATTLPPRYAWSMAAVTASC